MACKKAWVKFRNLYAWADPTACKHFPRNSVCSWFRKGLILTSSACYIFPQWIQLIQMLFCLTCIFLAQFLRSPWLLNISIRVSVSQAFTDVMITFTYPLGHLWPKPICFWMSVCLLLNVESLEHLKRISSSVTPTFTCKDELIRI